MNHADLLLMLPSLLPSLAVLSSLLYVRRSLSRLEGRLADLERSRRLPAAHVGKAIDRRLSPLGAASVSARTLHGRLEALLNHVQDLELAASLHVAGLDSLVMEAEARGLEAVGKSPAARQAAEEEMARRYAEMMPLFGYPTV